MQQYCIILTTTNSRKILDEIINILLDMNLASCIQIEDIKSYFKWEGKLTSEKEYRAIIKAKSDNYKKIEEIIVKIHNYEVPQIIKIDIDDGLKAYLNWISSEGNGL
ncbi:MULTISPECIES: divalent-cation tolerance protein CutA [unclassified Rickettsia]|uniref:divalent-cation tolerance protein CutA n=1 Tax=unclassified Rickettsia TaxID=114295 RepID=UPI003132C9B4